jgi:hypothetical protein
MPSLNYVNNSETSVGVTYADMPVGTEVMIVNTTTGAKTPSQSDALSKGGNGSADIPIDRNLAPAGEYHLLAQSATGGWLAQTVSFYLS